MWANLLEVWQRRELVRALVSRDLKVRYRNSFLGFLWSLLTPLLMMVVFTLVFKYGVRLIKEEDYSVKLICALLPWLYFQNSVVQACSCILMHRDLVKKVYFPREVLPLAVVGGNLIHYLLSLCVLFAYFVGLRVDVSPAILFLPVIILVQTLLTMGLSFFVAVLHTFFHDTEYVVNATLMVLFYASPVIYMASYVQVSHRRLFTYYMLNPMAVFAEGYRGVLIGNRLPEPTSFLITTLIAVGVFIAGYRFFRARQWQLPEVL
jgi:lipopolysaccharide transport system permease protein